MQITVEMYNTEYEWVQETQVICEQVGEKVRAETKTPS